MIPQLKIKSLFKIKIIIIISIIRKFKSYLYYRLLHFVNYLIACTSYEAFYKCMVRAAKKVNDELESDSKPVDARSDSKGGDKESRRESKGGDKSEGKADSK